MRQLPALLLAFEAYLNGLARDTRTTKCQVALLRRFIVFLAARGIRYPTQIGEREITDFITSLKPERRIGRESLKPSTLARYVRDIQLFFRFLLKNEVILRNPFDALDLKRFIRVEHEPRGVFTIQEITGFLEAVEPNDAHGLRERSLFELLYASGLRVNEARKLDICDLDLSTRVLIVRKGKGGKDRYVPLSKVATVFVMRYLETSRPQIVNRRYQKVFKMEDQEALFITRRGRISIASIQLAFKRALQQADLLGKNLTPHSIRHTTATHLLEAGAGIRYVQELLGHASIETTVRYTRLSLKHLRRAYKSAHPRENDYYEEIDQTYLDHIACLKKELLG
jgi:integrase/recombinase XerD